MLRIAEKSDILGSVNRLRMLVGSAIGGAPAGAPFLLKRVESASDGRIFFNSMGNPRAHLMLGRAHLYPLFRCFLAQSVIHTDLHACEYMLTNSHGYDNMCERGG